MSIFKKLSIILLFLGCGREVHKPELRLEINGHEKVEFWVDSFHLDFHGFVVSPDVTIEDWRLTLTAVSRFDAFMDHSRYRIKFNWDYGFYEKGKGHLVIWNKDEIIFDHNINNASKYFKPLEKLALRYSPKIGGKR